MQILTNKLKASQSDIVFLKLNSPLKQITQSVNNIDKMSSIRQNLEEGHFLLEHKLNKTDLNNNVLIVKKTKPISIDSSQETFKGKKLSELVVSDSDSGSDSDSETIVGSNEGTICLEDTFDDDVFEDFHENNFHDEEDLFERNDADLVDEIVDFSELEYELFKGYFLFYFP